MYLPNISKDFLYLLMSRFLKNIYGCVLGLSIHMVLRPDNKRKDHVPSSAKNILKIKIKCVGWYLNK